MKKKADLVRAWLRKADSDERAMDASVGAGALDAACFHAQQAAEKLLKAYLIRAGVQFPFTHNLAKLLELCAGADPEFKKLRATVEPLTPYAVELRYDVEFWPSPQEAARAVESVGAIKQFVKRKLAAS